MKSKLFIMLFIVIAVSSFSTALYLYGQQHVDLSNNVSVVSNEELQPVRLIIESLDLDLPIYGAEISDGRWQTTKEGVSYLKTSPMPGEIGNSIIYGHNWANLLGNLYKIEVDGEITVGFSDNTFVGFVVVSKGAVTKDQTHILNQQDYSKLTLYTCDNFLDSKRFVVTALPKEINEGF